MSGHFCGKRHEADMRLHRLNKLWCAQDWEHQEVDDLHEAYDNLEIRLCIPNGGYIGVSVWDTDRRLGWALSTELLAEHDNSWYSDKDRHVNLGLEAIARLRNILKPKKAVGRKPMKPSPGQMSLLNLQPASQAETAEPLAAQREESGPAAADFAVGSLVRCVKPTSSGRLPWGGRQGVVNRIAGDRIYVQYDQWPPYPHRLGDLAGVDGAIL